jgi:hypothetical protein
MHKLFKTKLSLWNELKDKAEGLDFNATLRSTFLSFVMEDGTSYRCGDVKTFVNTINEVFGFNFDPRMCRKSGKNLTLFWDDKSEEVKEIKIEEEVTPEVLISLEAEQEESVSLDLSWLDGLENNKKSKDKLDKYAEDEHGIKLNRRNTLENMIKDFKKQLSEV